jgi:hypothetical protein
VLLIGSLALWPRFIEARFSSLLDVAERLISDGVHEGAHFGAPAGTPQLVTPVASPVGLPGGG